MSSAGKVVPIETAEEFNRDLAEPNLDDTIARSCEFLKSLQNPDGHWRGELVVDSTLCSDVILFLHWRGNPDATLVDKCAAHIRKLQQHDGGWNIYANGPSEVNASVKSYFALKLAGDSPDAPWMHDARAAILRMGGIPRMNSYSKLYLALMGQFRWEFVPSIPVEAVLFPKWLPLNLYEVSSWTRAMIVPLAIISHFKPTRILPPEHHLHELFPVGTEQSDFSLPRDPRHIFSWRNFFLAGDRILKLHEKSPIKPLRKRALAEAETWMLERLGEGSDGLAAIFPAMLNALIALQCLGYKHDHPIYQKAWKDFEDLFIDDPDDFRIEPCLSPVWDTSITAIALGEAGREDDIESLQSARQWLEDREVRFAGDWKERVRGIEPSGWAFEYHNQYYPDTDDTAMVLMAMRYDHEAGDATRACIVRALKWQMAFQCKDGGWGAFDRNIMQRWLEDVPFADHNAILDPTCSDLTARTLEMLGCLARDSRYFSCLSDAGIIPHCTSTDQALAELRNAKPVLQAIDFLRMTQEEDGSWYGRWGVNYIYGVWQVLRGLAAIGYPMDQAWLLRGRDWLESCQNDDGGWGETCATYDDPSHKGLGPSTPSQTAWALMGLCACGNPDRQSIQTGVQYLINEQNEDGSWPEEETTGTGFPNVFYLKYDIYRNHFPLLALATYRKLEAAGSPILSGQVAELARDSSELHSAS